MKRPMNFEHQTELSDATDVFYIDSIKFVTLTKASTASETIDQNMTSLNDFFRLLMEAEQSSCVVELSKNYFSFWCSDDKYYIFQPTNYRSESPKCVQFNSFDCLRKYLERMFIEVEPQCKYRLYGVEILKINNHVLSGEKILTSFFHDLTGKGSVKSDDLAEEAVGSVRHLILPVQHTNQTSYESLTECTDVLRCPKSLDRVSHRWFIGLPLIFENNFCFSRAPKFHQLVLLPLLFFALTEPRVGPATP